MSSSENHRSHFSHPTEEAFAQILDFYGIEWQYEPRTFPLEWDEYGEVTQGFSPDFYLPSQNLYIELTTLRPRLTTIKNRKIRRLQELYPEIHIKLLKRRELRDLMVKYGLTENLEGIQGPNSQKKLHSDPLSPRESPVEDDRGKSEGSP